MVVEESLASYGVTSALPRNCAAQSATCSAIEVARYWPHGFKTLPENIRGHARTSVPRLRRQNPCLGYCRVSTGSPIDWFVPIGKSHLVLLISVLLVWFTQPWRVRCAIAQATVFAIDVVPAAPQTPIRWQYALCPLGICGKSVPHHRTGLDWQIHLSSPPYS